MKFHKRSNIGYIEFYFGPSTTFTTSKTRISHLLTDFHQIVYSDEASEKMQDRLHRFLFWTTTTSKIKTVPNKQKRRK